MKYVHGEVEEINSAIIIIFNNGLLKHMSRQAFGSFSSLPNGQILVGSHSESDLK